ncbi:hypothetical protein M3Y98_00717600 [Aphelenchoides besseyi]|nr:hypothetical protein M3Y98_00717600 [Aphelenchoides besseyi]
MIIRSIRSLHKLKKQKCVFPGLNPQCRPFLFPCACDGQRHFDSATSLRSQVSLLHWTHLSVPLRGHNCHFDGHLLDRLSPQSALVMSKEEGRKGQKRKRSRTRRAKRRTTTRKKVMSQSTILFVFLAGCSLSVLGSGLFHHDAWHPHHLDHHDHESHGHDGEWGSKHGDGWGENHADAHDHAHEAEYAKGDAQDWARLDYGGHKNHASGDSYAHGYANEHGDGHGEEDGWANGHDGAHSHHSAHAYHPHHFDGHHGHFDAPHHFDGHHGHFPHHFDDHHLDHDWH